MDVAGERLQIEADRVGKIELSDDGDVGGVEDGGVFEHACLRLQWWKRAPGQVLTEIEAGGADELAKRL